MCTTVHMHVCVCLYIGTCYSRYYTCYIFEIYKYMRFIYNESRVYVCTLPLNTFCILYNANSIAHAPLMYYMMPLYVVYESDERDMQEFFSGIKAAFRKGFFVIIYYHHTHKMSECINERRRRRPPHRTHL